MSSVMVARRRWRTIWLIVGCCALLGLFAAPASAAAAPCPTTQQPVTVAGFQVGGCATAVSRDVGGPLYIISGTSSLGGVSLSPTGATQRYPRESIAGCSGPCADAVTRFWNADDGPQILVDPTAVRIESNNPYALSVGVGATPLTLYSGRIHLAARADPTKLIDLDVARAAALLGLPVQGRFQLSTDATGVRLHLNLGLPSILGGATGETDVSVASDGSVMLNQLSVSVGFGRLGGLDVSGLAFVYDATTSSWQGTAMLRLPAPSAYLLRITLVVEKGTFKSITGTVSNLNVSLGYGAFLQSVGASFGLDPVTLGGTIGLSAGPRIAGVTALSIVGRLQIIFPSAKKGGNPFTRIEAGGDLSIVGRKFASGRLAVQSNGLVEGGARFGQSASVGSFSAAVAGAASSQRFNLEGRGRVSVDFGFTDLSAQGRAIVSSTGFAACAEFGGWLEGGIGRKWGRSFAAFDGCDLGPFRVAVKREPLAPDTFRIASGLPEAAVNVAAAPGAVAPPRFVLVDPKGTRVTEPSGPGTITKNVAVVEQAEDNTTTVVLRRPRAGRWRLEPVAGSAAVGSIDVADGLAATHATARVTGIGSVRTLHWTLRAEPGQTVAFVEHGPEDSKVITTTDAPSGSVRFDVPPGLGGDREITAEFDEGGLPRVDQVVAHYTAPNPATPAKPKITSTSRVATSADIRWEQPDGSPDHYELTTQSSDGEVRDVELPGSARRYTFTTDRFSDALSVTVTAVNVYDVAGPTLSFRYIRG